MYVYTEQKYFSSFENFNWSLVSIESGLRLLQILPLSAVSIDLLMNSDQIERAELYRNKTVIYQLSWRSTSSTILSETLTKVSLSAELNYVTSFDYI